MNMLGYKPQYFSDYHGFVGITVSQDQIKVEFITYKREGNNVSMESVYVYHRSKVTSVSRSYMYLYIVLFANVFFLLMVLALYVYRFLVNTPATYEQTRCYFSGKKKLVYLRLK